MRYSTPLITVPLVAFVAFVMGVILALAMTTLAAHAQEVADTTVNAEPWVVAFMPFVQVLVTGFIGLLTTFLGLYMKAKYDIDWEKENRDAFQTSATNAAGLYINKVGAQAAAATVDVHSPALKEFIDYVGKGAPKAIANWGITPERVAKTILSKVSQILPVDGMPVSVTPIADLQGRDETTGRYTR